MTDTSPDLGALLCRLEHLERHNQRVAAQIRRTRACLRLVLALTGLGLVGALVPANQAGAQGREGPKVVRANAFIIADREGRERGSLGYNDVERHAVLNLQPEPGARINMGVGRDGMALRMTHGKNDINLGYTDKGGTYLLMNDREGQTFFQQRMP